MVTTTGECTANKLLMSSSIWHELITILKWRNLGTLHVRKYLTQKFIVEDPRIQFRGSPAHYVDGCHVTLVTHGVLGYVPYQKGVTEVHPGNRCPTRKVLGLCSMIVFQVVLSLDISSQTVFSYHMSVKYIGRRVSDVFRAHVTHWL